MRKTRKTRRKTNLEVTLLRGKCESMFCHFGSFIIGWRRRIEISRTIHILNGIQLIRSSSFFILFGSSHIIHFCLFAFFVLFLFLFGDAKWKFKCVRAFLSRHFNQIELDHQIADSFSFFCFTFLIEYL